MNSTDLIAGLARRMATASRVTILTGAGVSAASGVPTFRGIEGLWKNYTPEKLATPEAFRRDPKLVWEWYNWRREIVARCSPNAAHCVIADWSRRYTGLTVITQNVDGLHERAGARSVVRFHGSIWEILCWQGCPGTPARWWDDTVPLPQIPPACPYCGGLARPGVVWFGEAIDAEILQRSLAAADCDLFLAVGTSAVVYPAAGLATEAHRSGAYTVEVNPEVTPASGVVDLAIQGRAEEILPAIDRMIQERLPITNE